MTDIRLARVTLPDFGEPTVEPKIPGATYEARMASLRERMHAGGYDALVVYADHEHSANMAYLTGFDPRFEEALLVVPARGRPTLVVGNECMGYADISPLDLHKVLFQSFSLPGQSRERSQSLDSILSDAGVRADAHVGVLAWKPFTSRETGANGNWIEAPAYLVDALRALTGDAARVNNAANLLIRRRAMVCG